jgi:hypothetical protein
MVGGNNTHDDNLTVSLRSRKTRIMGVGLVSGGLTKCNKTPF